MDVEFVWICIVNFLLARIGSCCMLQVAHECWLILSYLTQYYDRNRNSCTTTSDYSHYTRVVIIISIVVGIAVVDVAVIYTMQLTRLLFYVREKERELNVHIWIEHSESQTIHIYIRNGIRRSHVLISFQNVHIANWWHSRNSQNSKLQRESPRLTTSMLCEICSYAYGDDRI